jgi:DnaJ family protein C protein 2
MEKENKKLSLKHLKKERLRIIKLVETAYANDPRIKRMKDEEEAEKKRKKMEKTERKEKVRLEAEAIRQ